MRKTSKKILQKFFENNLTYPKTALYYRLERPNKLYNPYTKTTQKGNELKQPQMNLIHLKPTSKIERNTKQ